MQINHILLLEIAISNYVSLIMSRALLSYACHNVDDFNLRKGR